MDLKCRSLAKGDGWKSVFQADVGMNMTAPLGTGPRLESKQREFWGKLQLRVTLGKVNTRIFLTIEVTFGFFMLLPTSSLPQPTAWPSPHVSCLEVGLPTAHGLHRADPVAEFAERLGASSSGFRRTASSVDGSTVGDGWWSSIIRVIII